MQSGSKGYLGNRPLTTNITDICAVVVTYNPNDSFKTNLVALSRQISNIVIIDNASQSKGLDIVKRAAAACNAHLIINTDNSGIAAALNQGVNYGIDNGFEWIATFDQDSSVTPNYFVDLLNVAKAVETVGKLALVAPYYADETTGLFIRLANKYHKSSDGVEFGIAVPAITSGNLIPVRTFDIVGKFDEALFIDHVDHDFCFRCAAQGLLVVEAKNVRLNHSIGRMVFYKTKFRKKPFASANHSAFRHYFIARNRLIIYQKYFFKHPKWCLYDMKEFCKGLIVIALCEDNKANKLINTARGLMHGLVRRTGRAPIDLAK